MRWAMQLPLDSMQRRNAELSRRSGLAILREQDMRYADFAVPVSMS